MKKRMYSSLLALFIILSVGFLGCAGSDGSSGGDNSPLTPTLGWLIFDYYGGTVDGGYDTDVEIYTSDVSETDYVYFWLNDGTDTAALDEGEYILDLDSEAPGTCTDAQFYVGWDGGTYSDWAAATFTKSVAELMGMSFGAYDQITSGSVDVSVSGAIYTFSWSFRTADGDTIAGSYSGEVDESF